MYGANEYCDSWLPATDMKGIAAAQALEVAKVLVKDKAVVACRAVVIRVRRVARVEKEVVLTRRRVGVHQPGEASASTLGAARLAAFVLYCVWPCVAPVCLSIYPLS